MLHRLCGSPSIPLSFSLAAVVLRRYTYHVCLNPETIDIPRPSVQRLRRGLQGYLILFAPHAFVPQCQFLSSKLPSPSVFFGISTHFTATLQIPLAPPVLQSRSFERNSGLSPEILHPTHMTTYAPFTPSKSE